MRNSTSQTILLDAVLPGATALQNLLLVVAGSLLVALCAQLAVPLPFSPVPVTGQTFAVLLLGATLGARRSAAALLLYLAEGGAGLPVFAPVGAPGLARLLGPTGGYLWAYPLAAFLVGKILETSLERRVATLITALLAAEAVIFSYGTIWLKHVTGLSWQQAVQAGLLPFLPGEAIKMMLVGLCLPASWWALERRRGI